MHCKHCGEKIEKDSKFCSFCGGKITHTEKIIEPEKTKRIFQNTEEITDPTEKGSQVIAGPYHPAFRQLVESRMWYDEIVQKIKQINIKVMQVTITANPDNINNIIGYKK